MATLHAAVGCGSSGGNADDGDSSGSAGSTSTDGTEGSSETGESDESGETGDTEQSLFPLAVGNSWTWMSTTCNQEEFNLEVVGMGEVDGYDAFLTSNDCLDTLTEGAIRREGLDRTWDHIAADDEWLLSVDEPVEDGHQWVPDPWRPEPDSVTWEGPVDMTVPAGSFTDCWRQIWASGSTVVYCRGVGVVKVEYGGDVVRELLDYTIVDG